VTANYDAVHSTSSVSEPVLTDHKTTPRALTNVEKGVRDNCCSAPYAEGSSQGDRLARSEKPRFWQENAVVDSGRVGAKRFDGRSDEVVVSGEGSTSPLQLTVAAPK
jgi:hypothetical protein